MAQAQIVELDLDTLTLGEMGAVEIASGIDFDKLISRRVTRLLVGMFLHELRNSEKPRSWQELSRLHLSDVRPSSSQSSQDSPSQTSSD